MTSTDKGQTLDQRRAAHAWAVAQRVNGLDDGVKKQFGTQVKKLPTRILAASLGQALAFLKAKKYAPDLREALDNWLHERRPARAGEDQELLLRVIHGDADFLRFATAECLAYLLWLVRFADALGLTAGQED
jgi:CRISPR-associated protein Cmr5